MKKLTILLVLLLAGFMLQAQTKKQTVVTKEPVEITVYTGNNKLITDALFSMTNAPVYQMADEKGVARLYPKEGDTIYITVNNHVATVPYAGEQKMEFCFDKSEVYLKNAPEQTYAVEKLPKFNLRRMYTNPNIESYGSLVWLIQQKIPSIYIVQKSGIYEAYLTDSHTGRDIVAISSAGMGNNPDTDKLTGVTAVGSDLLAKTDLRSATVFVDGKIYPNIHKASNDIPLNQLVTITFKKPDTYTGNTGTGTIYITTLKGESKR